MTTKININELRSRVMKTAWKLFREEKGRKFPMNFATCLKCAWDRFLCGVYGYVRKVQKVQYAGYLHGAEEYYHGAGSRGRYFGD